MSSPTKFESSGLKRQVSNNRGQSYDQPLSGLMEQVGQDEDGLLEGEVLGEARSVKPRAASPRQAAVPRSASMTNKKSKQTAPNKSAPRRTPSRTPPLRKSNSHDLKATAAPLLATVGGLLMVPALWSALLLIGVGVPGSGRDDARPMAAVMLVSWPIAICLIAASVVFFRQVVQEKKRLAKQ